MNYSLVIEDRKSTREYKKKAVGADVENAIRAYHDKGCMRLFPEIGTEVYITGTEAKEKLEGAAGYKEFIAGSPGYMILLSDEHEYAGINAGYMVEDISLMLIDMGYGVCFVTFTDSDEIKKVVGIESDRHVAAILAFGNPERARKKMHVNLLTMAGISFKERQQYFAPKKGALDLAYLDKFGNKDHVDEKIDFYGDLLWESLLAASNSPSYMNRQPYAFIIKDHRLVLVSLPDEWTGDIDRELNLGVVMQHVAAVALPYNGSAAWTMGGQEVEGLPEGGKVIAEFEI